MIISFKNQGTRDIFDGKNTKEARKTFPASLNRVATHKLDQINAAINLQDLQVPPNNRLETLLGDRAGQHSIRINAQYRICFIWTETGAEQVEIIDYH